MNYSTEEKARLVEGWRESGKSISAYVKEHGLVRWTFHKWLKAEREASMNFVEVPAAAMRQSVSEILIEKGDLRIHIPVEIGLSGLRAVMEGMGAR